MNKINAQLLSTDTDSLDYEIEAENWYRDMLEKQDQASMKKTSLLGTCNGECGGQILEYEKIKPNEHDNEHIFKLQGSKKYKRCQDGCC